MEVTTVKLHKGTKLALDRIKQRSESYDEIILKLLAEKKMKNLKSELVEAYSSMGEQDLKILEDWETASNEL